MSGVRVEILPDDLRSVLESMRDLFYRSINSGTADIRYNEVLRKRSLKSCTRIDNDFFRREF